METIVQLYNDFLKKYASETNNVISSEKLDAVKQAFIKLYKKNIDVKTEPVVPDLKKNPYGNMENPSTKLVFVEHSEHGHVAIGKQFQDKLLPLTIHDILVCYNMKWKYSLSNCIGSAENSRDCAYAVEL